ncbi:matrixin family metalloprotease [Arthrobacter sp. PsM3]|uniref:matrixin family metalloprotease n=1 Tax=Arthrobacter sp. PsM3 TaxID=3030531 RepID=UPI00263BC2AE|nr:matrixin family metalloprotease [Arthrobacter sp. PsM3]MDN4646201.1 matrixin family metalloprotease [Arthrobacter sp. PsM3]
MFINDGATTEALSAQHQSYQPARYGDRWAPALIAWETSAEEPRFTNKPVGSNIMGLGGSEAVSIDNSGYTYVSGQLELNGPALQAMIGRNGPAQAQGVIEHELGHVVGLDHVQDPTQLMNPSNTAGVTTYQAGDLNGLAILGQGACRHGDLTGERGHPCRKHATGPYPSCVGRTRKASRKSGGYVGVAVASVPGHPHL